MSRLRLFPGLLFALLGVNIAVVGATLYFALSDDSFAVEPDYYHKAVTWDATAAQQAANAELGWKITLERDAGGLIALVSDSTGRPIEGAAVNVICFHSARAADRRELTLTECAPGTYAFEAAPSRPGVWIMRFTVTRGDVNFTAELNHLVREPG